MLTKDEPGRKTIRSDQDLVLGPQLSLQGAAAKARQLGSEYIGAVTVSAGLLILFAIAVPDFFTTSNFTSTWQNNAVLLIVSVGLTFPMVGGGFDLSVGGVVPVAGIILQKLLFASVPMWAAVVIVILGGVLFGILVNGIVIGYFKVNFFIVTLGSLTALGGLALQLTGGTTVLVNGHKFLNEIGSGTVGAVPVSGLVSLGVLILAILAFRYTGYGRAVYAVGGNADAARLAGIRVALVKCLTYGVSAGLAAVGGIVEVGRLAAAGPTNDASIELTAAAAVLIGGVKFGGGKGTMLGTLLGVFFLSILAAGLLISGISAYLTELITGLVLIAAVALDRLRRT